MYGQPCLEQDTKQDTKQDTSMEKLESDNIEARMESVPDWTLSGDNLQRTIGFDDFRAAMEFVNKLADAAEASGHHPDIMIRYGKVTLTLTTHDAGGLTEKDFEMAARIDALQPI
ncbi:MAG: 4a-hydroxytetrahydrobiopterin dehydratase [Phycisphaerales bacterium]|nr:4a-hydroxytetrahydrobiopterin dehydratase [Phycisphaerales bacterium]